MRGRRKHFDADLLSTLSSHHRSDCSTPVVTMKFTAVSIVCMASTAAAFTPSTFVKTTPAAHRAAAYFSSALCMKYKVAVVGGGPSGACAAEIFAQEKGIDTVLFERKLDNAKPCGGAIPLCMVGEFNLPETVVDRKVCDD
jgi:geranylgeranyl diphosphate/geranylgeranyl-bacteriochlorophyllide a reductase